MSAVWLDAKQTGREAVVNCHQDELGLDRAFFGMI